MGEVLAGILLLESDREGRVDGRPAIPNDTAPTDVDQEEAD